MNATIRLRARVLSTPAPDTLLWIEDADVQIDATGRIHHVGPWTGGPCDADVRDGVLTPGFVDGHVHFPQTRIIGAASGPLLDWLASSTFPEEARFADTDHATKVAARFTTSLAAAGTTLSMAYSSVHPAAADALFQAFDRSGLRTIAGPVLMDDGGPEPLMLPVDQAIPALSALADRWHGHDDGRLQVAVIPRFALSCTATMMAEAGRLARARDLWVTTHLSENPAEVVATCEKFGADDYLSVYEAADLVHARSVYAHCIHPTASEWARLADARAVIAHCPDSNDFLGSGGMPAEVVLGLDLPMVLGTDVAAGRSFRVPRIASSAFDNALRQGLRISPVRWLYAATRGGALALGHPQLGLVAPGMDADLVLHDVPDWVQDADQALGWILFHHDAPPVRATWVRGRKVWDRDVAMPGAGYVWR